MASQKRNRSASRQGKSGGTVTRSSGPAAMANGRTAGNRTGQGQNSRGQNGRQNGTPRNGQPRSTGPGQGRPDGPGRSRAAALTADKAVAGKAAGTGYGAPPWLRWTTLALSVAGLGVSIYLTIAHYTSPKFLICSNNGVIDCAKVTTSSQSMVFGVLPVAVLGLAFYVFMVAVNTPWAWRAQIPAIWWARLGSVIVGMGFVLYLIYAEIIQIGNICLWCTSVHVITFLLFVLIVFAASIRSIPSQAR
jgi:uncharacterized membrane protein